MKTELQQRIELNILRIKEGAWQRIILHCLATRINHFRDDDTEADGFFYVSLN